jgi:DNA-binding response OmpR family regulator
VAYSARVLLVDDEEELRELIAFELRDEGFDVMEAGSGNDAIEILGTSKFEFVISDIRMPRGDGVKLLKWIVESLRLRPIVFLMTGFAEVSREEVIKMGAKELLEKPFTVRGLVAQLKALLDSPSV